MTGVSSSSMGRSSARFSFVSEAESTIHHLPWVFTNAAADLQSSEVLSSDGTQCEQCHHQPIANLTCSGELSHFSRVFGLVYQRQAGFHENLG